MASAASTTNVDISRSSDRTPVVGDAGDRRLTRAEVAAEGVWRWYLMWDPVFAACGIDLAEVLQITPTGSSNSGYWGMGLVMLGCAVTLGFVRYSIVFMRCVRRGLDAAHAMQVGDTRIVGLEHASSTALGPVLYRLDARDYLPPLIPSTLTLEQVNALVAYRQAEYRWVFSSQGILSGALTLLTASVVEHAVSGFGLEPKGLLETPQPRLEPPRWGSSRTVTQRDPKDLRYTALPQTADNAAEVPPTVKLPELLTPLVTREMIGSNSSSSADGHDGTPTAEVVTRGSTSRAVEPRCHPSLYTADMHQLLSSMTHAQIDGLFTRIGLGTFGEDGTDGEGGRYLAPNPRLRSLPIHEAAIHATKALRALRLELTPLRATNALMALLTDSAHRLAMPPTPATDRAALVPLEYFYRQNCRHLKLHYKVYVALLELAIAYSNSSVYIDRARVKVKVIASTILRSIRTHDFTLGRILYSAVVRAGAHFDKTYAANLLTQTALVKRVPYGFYCADYVVPRLAGSTSHWKEGLSIYSSISNRLSVGADSETGTPASPQRGWDAEGLCDALDVGMLRTQWGRALFSLYYPTAPSMAPWMMGLHLLSTAAVNRTALAPLRASSLATLIGLVQRAGVGSGTNLPSATTQLNKLAKRVQLNNSDGTKDLLAVIRRNNMWSTAAALLRPAAMQAANGPTCVAVYKQLASCGRWGMALKATTVLLHQTLGANSEVPPRAAVVSACASTALLAGRWRDAAFYAQRAAGQHGIDDFRTTDAYNATLYAAARNDARFPPRSQKQSAVDTAVRHMVATGGMCGQEGVQQAVAAAKDPAGALEQLVAQSRIQWVD